MLQEGPGTQPAMQLRVARHTERLQEVVRFYRDGIGLTQIGGFRGHDGYDGVFLAVPGTTAHLELTAGGGHGAPAPHPESLLVFYLGDEATVQAAARLGVDLVRPANPYWAEHGLTFQAMSSPPAARPFVVRPGLAGTPAQPGRPGRKTAFDGAKLA